MFSRRRGEVTAEERQGQEGLRAALEEMEKVNIDTRGYRDILPLSSSNFWPLMVDFGLHT